MKKLKTFKKVVVLFLIAGLMIVFVPGAQAGEYEDETDVLTRLKASTASSHDITFDLSSGVAFDADETITVDFGEDSSYFVVDGPGSATADFGFNDGTERTIVDVDGACAGHDGVNDVVVGIVDATGVVTFTACGTFTSSSSGATINIEYGTVAGGTNRVTNPTAQNDVPIYLAGTVGDTGSIAISILSDDQVVVTATVDATFTFDIDSPTCALGTLNTGSVSSCNYDVTTSANSEDGYATTIVEDGDLIDGSNDIDDVSDGTVTAGVEEYGIGLTGTDRSFTDERPITSSAQTIASDATGPISSQAVTVTHKASIVSTTSAGSYSHTVTLVSTGTF